MNSCHILATRTPDQHRSSASPAAGAGAGVRKCREGRHHLLSKHLLLVFSWDIGYSSIVYIGRYKMDI